MHTHTHTHTHTHSQPAPWAGKEAGHSSQLIKAGGGAENISGISVSCRLATAGYMQKNFLNPG